MGKLLNRTFGELDLGGSYADAKWFFQNKQIEKELDVSKVVDNSFVDYAVQKLGKYQ